MTAPSGFHRPANPFTAPCPVAIRQIAWNALRAQAARLEARRNEKDQTDD